MVMIIKSIGVIYLVNSSDKFKINNHLIFLQKTKKYIILYYASDNLTIQSGLLEYNKLILTPPSGEKTQL